jgi:hypothetical protein
MPLMLSKLYDALLEAGASDVKAREAAEESAAFEMRFTRIEAMLGSLGGEVGSARSEMCTEFSSIRSDLQTLRWIAAIGFGVLAALNMAMLGVLWQIVQRLPSAD